MIEDDKENKIESSEYCLSTCESKDAKCSFHFWVCQYFLLQLKNEKSKYLFSKMIYARMIINILVAVWTKSLKTYMCLNVFEIWNQVIDDK